MSRVPKHRFDAEEAEKAYKLLTFDERREFDSLNISGGISAASNERLRTLETLAYSRLKEKNEQA